MGTAIELGRSSAKGGFNLFWGVAISSIISAIGVIIVARILDPSEYGLFAIVLIVPNLIEIIRDLGIDQSIINYTAKYNSENKPSKIKNTLVTGIIVELTLGILLSIISFFLASFVATNIFNRPEITPLIQIASFSIFGGSLFKVAQSAFTGYEKMEYHSMILIVQAILKAILMILFVSFGLGVYGATIGNTIAYIITGLTGITLLYLTVLKKIKGKNDEKFEVLKNFKKMFKYGFPLSISNIIIELKMQFFRFLIAIYLTDLIFGNYQAAKNFAVLVAVFVTPVQTILFPVFSKIDYKKEPHTLRNVFQSSVKYASLLIVPSTLMVIVLSKPAVYTIFGEKYELTPLYLSVLLLGYLYTIFGEQSSNNLIKSQGNTDVNLKLTILTSFLALILSITLIPKFAILGLLITYLTATIPSIVISLWWIKKHFNATVEWKSSARILLASVISAGVTHIVITQVNVSDWIILILGTIIFLTTTTITIPLTGAMDKQDVKNLQEMIKTLGPLARILNPILNIFEKLIITFQKK